MKKNLCVLFLNLICLQIFAQNFDKNPILSIGFTNTQIDNNITHEKEVLSETIRKQFEKIFHDYTTINVYDIENETSYIELNKNQGTIGMLETASNRATSSLKLIDSNLILNLQITDITTSKIISQSSASMNVENLSDYEKLNSLIGNVAVEVLQQLNINLSTSQILIIKGQKSETELSSQEMQDSILAQEKILKSLEEKIQEEKSKNNKVDNFSVDMLQIQHDRLEQKLKLQQKRLEQKQKDEANIAQEMELSKKRTKEQNEIIEKQRREYEAKAKQLRTMSFKTMNSESQIEVIEQNKQTILAMRKKMQTSISDFTELTNKNAKEDCYKIDSEPFSAIEKDAQGNPLPRIIREREEQKNLINQEAKNKIESYKKQVNSQQEEFENKIKAEINNDYKMLKKTQSISSIDNPNLLRINNYDGGLYGWETTISFELGNSNIATYNSLLLYKSLFNKNPKINSQEYRNNVEEYNSYFRSNIPIVYAVVEYFIEPRESYYPSEYIVNITKTTFYNIDTGKKILSQNHKDLSAYYKCDTKSDIRTYQEKYNDQQKIQKELQKQIKVQDKTQAKVPKTNSLSISNTEQNFFTPQKHSGIVGNIQFNLDDLEDFKFVGALDFPLGPFFWGIGTCAKISTDETKTSTESDKILFNDFNMDFSFRLGMQFYGLSELISPYLVASIGMNYDFLNANKFYFVQGTFGTTILKFIDVNYILQYDFLNKSMYKGICVGLSIFGPWQKWN